MSVNQRGRKLALTIENPRSNMRPSIKGINISLNDKNESKEEASSELLSKILDTINSNSLNIFYPDSNNDFKKKIDSLNLKFYLETEKYLSNKNRSEKCQTSLFIILFKQINIYIEEIERLNLIIIKGKYDPKKIIERTDEIIKKQNEFLTKEKLIKTLKESKSNMEAKLLESIINEDKLKKEIEVLKRENDNFKMQLSQNSEKSKKLSGNGLNINMDIQKKKSNFLLHKLTHSTFHSSTIKNLINEGNKSRDPSSVEKKSIYYNQETENGQNSRKRNNSDNNKKVLNHSFKKYEKTKMKAQKILFKNCKNNKENIYNINNSAISNFHKNIQKYHKINDTNYLNKNSNNHIKLNNGLDNSNNYIGTSYQGINKSVNFDFCGIKPIKTECIISDIEEYKKGCLYDYNSNILFTDKKTNKFRAKHLKMKFCSKSKDKKEKNIPGKENTIFIKKNREKLVSPSSKQNTTDLGKNLNERKKRFKINI